MLYLSTRVIRVFFIIRGSSNGRTSGSGPENWGSNPYPRAKIIFF